MTAAIDIRGLRVRYRDVTAVDGIDLHVDGGELVGFLGPNGAGKTSTLRTLLDLLRPDAGVVRVLGEDVRRGGGALRGRVGYLPGDLGLLPELTGEETLALFSRLQGRAPASRDHVLDSLGFPRTALSRRVRTYSTGMRQMVGITIALQHDPDVVVLDEPTSGLDPLVRDSFLELVRALPRRGAAVFLSSHVLAEVEACADRVALIHEGRLLFVEPLAELRRRLPRQVVLYFADGRIERRTHTGPAGPLLDELPRDGLVDLVIRPASLDQVVRDAIDGDGNGRGQGDGRGDGDA